MAVHLLKYWCKGMNINPKNCLLVTGIPEAVDEGSIESILRAATELFSGGPTQIPREEGFEPWLEHTTEMLQEWAVPGAVKRRHLVECLRDQALDVIRTLTLSKPAVWVKVSFVALDHAFGRAEGSEDIYCKFLNATQRKGEKVSVYIQRFEKLLQRAIMRGALAVEERQENPPSYSWQIRGPRGGGEAGSWELPRAAGVGGSPGKNHTARIPPGLIGPRAEVTVKIEGTECKAVLDTRSQVTIIFQSCYQQILWHLPIQPLTGLGLCGLSMDEYPYPYQGYVTVHLEFPEEVAGVRQEALMCPNLKESLMYPD
uniref:Uncharacterized protein n=1 Tax=Chelonoidis abingdonii TaxID=106734 RepID=A0A8C0INV4_CHEAB